ncbi:MAG: type III-A CRISPR-associated protein Cas10/Csm1 [Coprococcus sp.]
MSKNILYDNFFGVVRDDAQQIGLPLPGGYSLIACHDEKDVREKFMPNDALVRIYGKNALYTGKNIATKLWVGDYNTGDTFEQLAESAEGIKRIAVLRADVDNLGQAIVSGFDGKVSGLSRTATLSRHLSIFFKYFIRDILEHGEYSLSGETKVHQRNAAIIYSGGDDVFIVGAWNEVIELAVDLRNKFKRYTQGTLSLSAGIGMYGASYPIAVIAGETGVMEERSKYLPGKDAVTLLEDGESHEMMADNEEKSISDGTYQWDCFEDKVVAEKYRTLAAFFDTTEKRGRNFLYKILELIRHQERMMKEEGDKIGFARLLYLLTRLEPTKDGEEKEAYRHFSKCMYQWIQSPEDCRQLKTAINLYAYMNRERGEGTDENNK